MSEECVAHLIWNKNEYVTHLITGTGEEREERTKELYQTYADLGYNNPWAFHSHDHVLLLFKKTRGDRLGPRIKERKDETN